MKGKLIIAALLLPTVVYAFPWSQDMMDQPSIKPQEPATVDGKPAPADKAEMYPFPRRSIPADGIPTKVANRDEAKPMVNPIPATEESVQTGRTLYRIICAACHGMTGSADSPVAGKIGAISLVDDYVQKQLTEGWIWGTISFGSFVMPAYGVPQAREDKRGSNDLTVEERWHVVNYVRHGLTADNSQTATQAETSTSK